MRIGSLFSGIGGLELGLEWAGVGETAWQVEIDPWCRSVLARHWPAADRSVVDVRCASRSTLAPVDGMAFGFPCQDVSGAGLGAGLEGARSGLWFEGLRVVEELRPAWVIVENVASGAKRWLCEVRTGLHALGYRTRALGIAASDVGAPHRRRRIFVLAYRDREGELQSSGVERDERRWLGNGGALCAPFPLGGRAVANAVRLGWSGAWPQGECTGRGESHHGGEIGSWLAECGVGRGPHGLPARVDRFPAGRDEEQYEWEPPRALPRPKGGGRHAPVAERILNRQPRLKALGNAVCPQAAMQAGLVLRNILRSLDAT